jgi:hypothetical protein
LHSLLKRGRLAAALSVVVAFALVPSAMAEGPTTATSITSPADPYFDYYDDSAGYEDANENGINDANELTVTGTANGSENLTLACVYGGYGGGGREYDYVADLYYGGDDSLDDDFTPDGNGGYTWSKTIDKYDATVYENQTRGDQTCYLKAVPANNYSARGSSTRAVDIYNDDLAPFSGPRLGMGYVSIYGGGGPIVFDRSAGDRARQDKKMPSGETRRLGVRTHDQNQVYDYEATFPQLKGYWNYYSVSSCGICYSFPFSAGTFAQPYYSSWYLGGYQDRFADGGPSQSALLIDGKDGFHTYDTAQNEYRYDCDNNGENCSWEPREGATELQGEIESFNHSTGDVTFVERDDVVTCDASDVDEDGDGVDEYQNGNMNADNCEQFVPTGIQFERRITQNRNGQVTSLKDRYISTDGQQHTVNAQYYNEVDYSSDAVWRIPGSESYASYDSGDEITLPAGPVSTFFGRDSYNNDNPQETGGPVSLTYVGRPDRAFFDYEDGLVFEYHRTVGAGGSTSLENIYGHALDKEGVEALGRSVEDQVGGGPVVDITTPGAGTTFGTSRITVSGTAGDNVGVETLKVNGKSVPVSSDGTWSTEIELAEGANTLTAVATDGEGQTATDSVAVTYKKADAGAPVVVTQQIAPPATTPANAAGKGKSSVNLKKKRVSWHGDEFVLTIKCAPGAVQNGTIRVRGALAGKNRNLGTEAFQCPGNGTRTVDFNLSRSEERMLRNSKKNGKKTLTFTAYIVARDLAGDAGTFRQTFTLVL